MDWQWWIGIIIGAAGVGIALWQTLETRRRAAKDGRNARPQFTVTAVPSISVATEEFGGVVVTVKNTSTRDAVINHFGVECLDGPGNDTYQIAGDTSLPHLLPAGHQLVWAIPADDFFIRLDPGDEQDADFVIFVGQDSALAAEASNRRWESDRFTVRRPGWL